MEGKPSKEAGEKRRDRPERRAGDERRKKDVGPPQGQQDQRLADRRTGMDRRRPHLHYEELTQHPRPERNINDYPLSTDELEFINAINDYKSKFGRPFPTWSEILHVLRTLGYIRLDADLPLPPGVSPDSTLGFPSGDLPPPKEGT
jgi:hypothetical protein